MEEIKNGLYRVTLDEVKAHGRMTEHDTFRFRCLVCGDEDKHRRRFDGSFNQREGVGQCFCCGSRFVLAREGNVDYTQEHCVKEHCVILSEYPSSIMAYLKQRGLKAL